MLNSRRVFIGRKPELMRLMHGARPASIRVVPVIVGPSGIGKTSLAREAAHRLHEEGYLTYHFYVNERITVLEDLYRVLVSSTGVMFSTIVEESLRGVLNAVLERLLGKNWRDTLRSTDALLKHSVYDILSGFFLELAKRAKKSGRKGVIVFIDEAQNMLKAMEPDDIWSFVKMLASLQEELPSESAAGFQAVLITSEYRFQQYLLRYSPSPDYIDTFYLGEMTRSDALSLYKYLSGGRLGEKEAELIDGAIGGHPVHLGVAAKRGMVDAVCRYVRRIQQTVVEYLLSLSGEREDVEEILARILDEPLARTSDSVRLLDELVKRGILQYGCRAYIGIYEWNSDCQGDRVTEYGCGGGGWCGGLDTVAPASRLARLGLALALKRGNKVPPVVRDTCRLPEDLASSPVLF